MKENFYSILILIILTALASYAYIDIRKKYINKYQNGEVINDTGVKVSKFKHENHDYLMFIFPADGGYSVIHNPDCESCLSVF